MREKVRALTLLMAVAAGVLSSATPATAGRYDGGEAKPLIPLYPFSGKSRYDGGIGKATKAVVGSSLAPQPKGPIKGLLSNPNRVQRTGGQLTFYSQGLTLGKILDLLRTQYGIKYVIEDNNVFYGNTPPTGAVGLKAGAGTTSAPSTGVATFPPPNMAMARALREAQGAAFEEGILAQKVWGYFTAPDVDSLVRSICKAADVYCRKNGDRWVISALEVYKTDLPYSFGQNIKGSNEEDSFSVGGEVYDTTLIKQIAALLSPQGRLVRSPAGFLWVMDRPSRIELIKQVIEAQKEHTKPIKLRVQVISFQAKNINEHGIDWNAILTHAGRAFSFSLSSTDSVNAGSSSVQIKFNSHSIGSFIKLLSEYGNVKILKDTTIDVRSGLPEAIVSAQQIPWTTQTTSSTDGGITTALQVNYKSVGLKVKVVPQLVDDDRVVGTIYAESSDLLSIEDFGNGVKAPKTAISSALINFSTQVGQSVVITGLTQTNSENTNSGVPLLKDLPLIGDAFSYKKDNHSTSQLLIILTPVEVGG